MVSFETCKVLDDKFVRKNDVNIVLVFQSMDSFDLKSKY
jgi:hypothetical protein